MLTLLMLLKIAIEIARNATQQMHQKYDKAAEDVRGSSTLLLRPIIPLHILY